MSRREATLKKARRTKAKKSITSTRMIIISKRGSRGKKDKGTTGTKRSTI